MSRLGHRQKDVLDSLVRFDGWNAWLGRWVWKTPGDTAKVCESLVKKGLAQRIGNRKLCGFYAYKATNEGEKLVKRGSDNGSR